jgi:sialidase-1
MGGLLKCLLLAIALLSVVSLAIAQDSSVERVDVFPPGMNGVARYRIPGLVVTPKGAVLAYCEARRNSSSDWGEIEVHLRRSIDGGKTWSPAQSIAHRGERIALPPRKGTEVAREQTVNNPVAIVDQQTGCIEFLYCVNYARCFSMRSEDDGLTWSQPVEITSAFDAFRKFTNWRVLATGPGHGIQLASGRLVVPVWLAYGNEGDHRPSVSGTIYSDDHGKSWNAGAIAFPNQGDFGNPNETMVAQLSDGRVMLVARNESKANRKLIAYSLDGASGWSEPVFHDQLWEPICMASLVTHPSAAGSLLFSNPHSLAVDSNGKEVPGGRGKRTNLSIQWSHDDGETWPFRKTLDAGPSAYSDLAVLPDGMVLCLYERDQSIVCARLNLEWIRKP